MKAFLPCVCMPPFVTKVRMFISSNETDMTYDSKYLHRMLELHGGNLQPS